MLIKFWHNQVMKFNYSIICWECCLWQMNSLDKSLKYTNSELDILNNKCHSYYLLMKTVLIFDGFDVARMIAIVKLILCKFIDYNLLIASHCGAHANEFHNVISGKMASRFLCNFISRVVFFIINIIILFQSFRWNYPQWRYYFPIMAYPS